MSADNRTVTTDALETLGSIIGASEKRDAIHLAVEPIEAAEDLLPGLHVGIVEGKASRYGSKHVGIVDPFLLRTVKKGERFWLIVYPRQITSLRHVWEHPDFAPSEFAPGEKTQKEASEQWLRKFDLIENAKLYLSDNDYWCEERFEGEGIGDDFWVHFENVTGIKKPSDVGSNFLSCSC